MVRNGLLLAMGVLFTSRWHLWLIARKVHTEPNTVGKSACVCVCRKTLVSRLPLGTKRASAVHEIVCVCVRSSSFSSNEMRVLRFIKATTSIYMTFECHFTWLHYTAQAHNSLDVRRNFHLLFVAHIYTLSFWHFISISSVCALWCMCRRRRRRRRQIFIHSTPWRKKSVR